MPVSFVLNHPFNTIPQGEQEEFALTKKMKKILDFYLIVSFFIEPTSHSGTKRDTV